MVLVAAERLVDLFVGVVASVKVDKTLEGSVLLVFESGLDLLSLAYVGHFLEEMR